MSEQDYKKIFEQAGMTHLPLEKMLLYKEGKMNKEMALEVERLLTNDPFLAEVMDDLDDLDAQQVSAITASVNATIDQRLGVRGGVEFAPILRYAAAAAIVATLGGAGWMFLSQSEQDQIEVAHQEVAAPTATQQTPTAQVTTNSIDPALTAELDRYQDILAAEVAALNTNSSEQAAPVRPVATSVQEAPVEDAVALEEVPEVVETPRDAVIDLPAPEEASEVVKTGIAVSLISRENPGAIGNYPDANQKISKNRTKKANAFGDVNGTSKKYTYDKAFAAQFPGGDAAMSQFVKDNITAPVDADGNAINGEVLVKFDVSHKGKVGKVSTSNAPKALQKEVSRVIDAMPTWDTASEGREKVTYRVSVRF